VRPKSTSRPTAAVRAWSSAVLAVSGLGGQHGIGLLASAAWKRETVKQFVVKGRAGVWDPASDQPGGHLLDLGSGCEGRERDYAPSASLLGG